MNFIPSFIATLFFLNTAGAAVNSEALKETVLKLPTCGNFLRTDGSRVFTGSGGYWTGADKPRTPYPAKFWSFPLNDEPPTEFSTLDSSIDLLTMGSTALVLTYSGIEEWNLDTKTRMAVHATHTNSQFGDEEHPRALARWNDQLIIAHGRLGVSFFDLKTKKVTGTLALVAGQAPLESVANGVAVSGDLAYVVMDSYTLVDPSEKPAFRGVVLIDMKTQKVVRELGGMEPGAESVVADEKNIIVSFYGQPLFKYAIASLTGEKMPAPAKRVWNFPKEGRALGSAMIDDKYYYTCFSRMPEAGEGTNFVRTKAVLDRVELGLN